MGGRAGGHAVVLGASIPGLLAARVLADAHEQVTIIERDELPDSHGGRRGVPQGQHLHAVLARGSQPLDELFPGLVRDLATAGVPSGDLLGGIRWLQSGLRISRIDIGQPVLFPSRPLLESPVRT
ncbi:hypothetical protein ACN27F_23855 [Solwaraspora sp. WMMB335]|uniref:hypothetical protein n=1 Tax=Solwaraspora sp. WMMB335 TaxID=3404118 RepID=UPI003B96488F